MSFLNEYNKATGVVFQDPLDDLIDEELGGGETPYSGLTPGQLDAAYKETRLNEEQYRAELKALGATPAAIEIKVADNRPPVQGPSAEEAGPLTLSGLSPADLIAGVKKGLWSAEEAYNTLRRRPGYNDRSAAAELQLGATTGENKPTTLSVQQIIRDAVIKASQGDTTAPGRAFQRLQSELDYTPEDAAALLEQAGWKRGGAPTAASSTTAGATQPPPLVLGQGGARAYDDITGTDYTSEDERAAYLRESQRRGGALGEEASAFLKTQPVHITPPNVGGGGLANMGQYDPRAIQTLYDAGRQAGFQGDALNRIVATSLAESGGNFQARNSTGEDSRGPLQINVGPGANPQYASQNLYDPYVAMRAAYQISGGGVNFDPWTVWHQNRGAPAQAIYSGLVGMR